MSVSREEAAKMKGKGFLLNRDGQAYSVRVVTRAGVLTSAQFDALSEAARACGDGRLALTARQSVEMQNIRPECADELARLLAKVGLAAGGVGPRVRPIVACKGTVCRFGLIDTQGLASELFDRYYTGLYDTKLPHKFKIAVGGCPNSCVKPELNDIGIAGRHIAARDEGKCRLCETCLVETGCPMGAAKKEGGAVRVDEAVCNKCGRCVSLCPFGAFSQGEHRCAIALGGCWGKRARVGTWLPRLFTERETVELVGRAIEFYKENGKPGERFGFMIDRLGEQAVFDALLQ